MPSKTHPSAKLALPTLALCCVMLSLAVETEAQLNFSTGWGKRSGGGDDSLAVGSPYASAADSFMDEKLQKQQQQQQQQRLSSDLDEFVRFYRRFRKARDHYQLQDPDA